ncbi:reverse transcriptase domain-containing protein [Trichonephila clavipes]|nr:reverse transcriptase domain-containing protein [Trichonephila clavipes]
MNSVSVRLDLSLEHCPPPLPVMREVIKIQKYLPEPFTTERGLRQGDSLVCLLFNLVLEKCVRDSGLDRSGTLWNRSLQLLAYTDDIDIIGRSEKAVKEAFQALEISATNVGLTINEDKPKFMETLPSSVNNTSFCVNGHSFERALQRTSSYIQVIRSNRLRWLGNIWRSPENNQTRAYTFKNPMGSRTRGRPPTRELLRIVGIGRSELWRQPRPVTGCYAYKEEINGNNTKGNKIYICGVQPKPSCLRAQAQLMRTETCGLLRIKERREKRAEKDGGSRAGVPVENSSKLIC